ncbi:MULTISPECIES: hypothetical protein [unclassified Actinoplanes]|uniref:hypothetical protein n=1 Tax=unclassified Actinoplanes TaxID=2626549 RepID=UPI0012BA80A0|nr:MULTISPECIES: hypothetical protein [unclassified Actinoplanes]
MTHLRPTSLAAVPLRWLLVVLTLCGLGLLQGAHCADTVATHTPHRSASTGTQPHAATRAAVTTVADKASTGGHTHPGHDHGVDASADGCDDQTRPATITVAAPVIHLPVAVARIGASQTRPATPRPRHYSTVTLTHIGVSRI